VADQGQLRGTRGEARVGIIDTRDIAPVAATLLTSPGHQGTRYFGAHHCHPVTPLESPDERRYALA
jgi:uncharacterized protein YbjT (DUF2867 family)